MAESQYLHKSPNVSVLLYRVVGAAKYRRVVFSEHIDEVLREACIEIAKRYERVSLEVGTDRNHVHFLIQSIPTYSPTKIVWTVKSLTARHMFAQVPKVKSSCGVGSFGGRGIS